MPYQMYQPEDVTQQPFQSSYLPKTKEQTVSSIFEIDNDDIIEKLVYFLRGYHFVEGEWLPIGYYSVDGKLVPVDKNINQNDYRLINEKGIAALVPLLRAHVDKLIIMSDLELQDIFNICRETCHAVIFLLAFNHEEFEVRNEAEGMDVIYNIIDHTIFSTVKRAHKGGERKYRGTIMKLVEQFVQKEEQKPQASMSLARLFKKKEAE